MGLGSNAGTLRHTSVLADLGPHLDLVHETLHPLSRRERETLSDSTTVDTALILELSVHTPRLPPASNR